MTDIGTRDFPWTGTGGLSDTQSYAWIILNAIFDRLSSSSFFSGFAVKRISAALPVEAWSQVPFLGIFLGEDLGAPDGDVNAGDIRFLHNFVVGVQIVVKNNDSTAMLQKLDQASWFALNQILRDNTLNNRLKTTLPDNVTHEGYPRVRFRPDVWGMAGTKNETPIGERLFWLTYQLRTEWYPTDFPDLERIVLTTAFPPGDATGQSQTEQVEVVYEFTPDSVATPFPPGTATTTALVSSLNPSTSGASVVFTATVTPSAATGHVLFRDGAAVIGAGALNVGVATFATTALAAGDHPITAEYDGDLDYAESTSPIVTQTVT